MGSAASGGCSGVDVASAAVAHDSWWASLAIGGRLYGIPHNAERVLIFDPATQQTTAVDTSRFARGHGKWRSAVSIGSKIYGVPSHAEQLLIFDLASQKASAVETWTLGRGNFKWQAAVVLGGKVYGVPHNAERMLVFDPATNKVSGVDTASVCTGSAKWLAGVVIGGKLYGVPCDSPRLLVYDPVAKRVSGVDVTGVAAGENKWLAAASLAGKLYGIPCHAECILVYDPATGSASGVSTSSVAEGPGKWTSAIAVAGKIYGIPNMASVILVFDPTTGLVSGIDVSGIASGPEKWQGAALLGGFVYCAPHDAESILVFNPSNDQVSALETSEVATGKGKWSTTVALGGKVYGIPCDSKCILVHEPEVKEVQPAAGWDLPGGLPEELIEDFVCAWVSQWVYNIEDPQAPRPPDPLRFGGEGVEWSVLKVHENSMEGSLARLAFVVARMPSGKRVLVLTFKGTKFVHDFVADASLSPDFAPFDRTFGDRSTFVHHGAHNAIVQLRVHQWAALCELIKAAAATGVSNMVIAGHSLGGQYAMAFLLEVFLDSSNPSSPQATALPPLLRDARCVTFGSPMCFGSAEGLDVRADLAAFVRGRSINYVNKGDPAPRLWSELDIEGFMRYFAERVRTQIPVGLRSLVDWAAGPGGLSQRAEEMLQRPDIDAQVLRPASRYVHLSRIRLLAEEFQPWRPLGRDRICLEDHAIIDGYLASLKAALDSSAGGKLFDEDGKLLV